MPTYEYRCDACSHELEEFQYINDPPLKKCPVCGKNKLKRLISGGAAIVFKGSGFYQTDYRSDTYQKAAKADSKANSGSCASAPNSTSSSPAGSTGKKDTKSSETNKTKQAK